MSISSMTNVALDRKVGPPTWDLASEAKKGPVDQGAVTKALDVVMAYVPTEIVALYVAVVAALKNTSESIGALLLCVIFSVATPIVVWVIYAGKFRIKERRLPLTLAEWPRWEMVASFIAFPAWAFALPGGPFEGGRALAGIGVLVVSVALGLAAMVFGPLPKK